MDILFLSVMAPKYSPNSQARAEYHGLKLHDNRIAFQARSRSSPCSGSAFGADNHKDTFQDLEILLFIARTVH